MPAAKKKNTDISKIHYLSNEKGDVVAVQVDIAYFQNLLSKVSDNQHEETMEDAIREIHEIEKGTLPKISLSSFLDEM